MTLKPLSLAIILLLLGLPALADDFNDAVKDYGAKNFASARDHLLAFVKTNHPNVFQGHYLLGNCYLQLNDLDNAKRSYAQALAAKPDATTRERCLKAIESIARVQPRLTPPTAAGSASPVSSSGSTAGRSTGTSGSAGRGSMSETRIKSLEAEIKTIRDEADRQIARIREEGKVAVDAYTESNGRWFRTQTGERIFTIRDEWKQEVLAPFNARIDDINRNVESRIEGKQKEIDDLSK